MIVAVDQLTTEREDSKDRVNFKKNEIRSSAILENLPKLHYFSASHKF